VLATRAANSAEEAVAVAEEIGFPVVLKARSGSLVHKSDVGVLSWDSRVPKLSAKRMRRCPIGWVSTWVEPCSNQ